MQKIIFFTPIPDTGKLATVVSDKQPKDLIKDGIIPSNSKFVIETLDSSNWDQQAAIYHIEYMKFDNPTNPQRIVLNKDMLAVALIEDIRGRRVEQLEVLDGLQFRASVMGLADLVDEIEADKEVLRNLPSTIDFIGRDTVRDMYDVSPVEIFINYSEKYGPKFKK